LSSFPISEPPEIPVKEIPLPKKYYWASMIQFVLSLLAFFILITLSFAVVVMGFGQMTSRIPGLEDPTPLFLYAAGLFLSAIMLLPSARYALMRLNGRAVEQPALLRGNAILIATGLLILGLPLVLLIGNWVSGQARLSWWALPALHILAVVIPLFWLLAVGLDGLSLGTRQRLWGTFGAGLVLGPSLILVAEIALLSLYFGVLILIVVQQSELSVELLNLAQRLRFAPGNPEVIARILQPYLLNPVVIVAVFSFIAFFVPLIEEVFKPVGVWLLAGHRLSPREGFVAGLLCGAGYALFENLLLSSTNEQWMSLILARMGTGAVHMATASLVGWGLASAWSEARYLRLGGVFACAVTIHALWNALTLLTAGVGLFPDSVNLPIARLETFFSVILGFLAFLCVMIIWLLNRSLKRAIITPPLEGDLK
jgi:hypothetical protein